MIESIEGYQMTDAHHYHLRDCVDMTQFCNPKRLCCWASLTPGSNESAGKKKSVRITRARVYLKPALVQCAHAGLR